MSKCKPDPKAVLQNLFAKGVDLIDTGEPPLSDPWVASALFALTRATTTKQPHEVQAELGSDRATKRYVMIRIPYDALLNDPEVQKAFQDLVTISSTE